MKAIQTAFTRGEISPSLYGRVNTEMYHTALATALNTVVHTSGGISSRPGSYVIGPVKDHAGSAPRLVRFEFKTTDQYVLEFGDQYMRVIRDDGYVLEGSPTNITAASATDPVVITSAAHGLGNGDEVYLDGVGGMFELNERRFVVANVTVNTYELTSQVDGSNIDGTGYTAYTSGGTADRIYEIATPWAIEDVFNFTFAQSADIMTVAHRDYQIAELARYDHNDWQITNPTFAPSIAWPTGIGVSANTTGTETYRYRVTAITEDYGEESIPGLDGTSTPAITGATNADPIVITQTAHGFVEADEVYIDSVGGMTEINDRRFIIANVTANTYELQGEDGTGYGTYTSGGSAQQTLTRITNGATEADNTITWDAVEGATRYAVYRFHNGGYGLIGETEALTFVDDNITPDTTISHPRLRNPFSLPAYYPQAVGFYQQRRVLGGSNGAPDTSEYSQIGAYSNFGVSSPLKATDAMRVVSAAGQVNEIRHYLSLNDLLIFTSGSEWLVNPGDNVGFSLDTINQDPQSYWGCSYRPPLAIGSTVVYVDASEAHVRSLAFSFQDSAYTGVDFSLLARHMLDGHTIVDWALINAPDSRVHMVREDGGMLTMTYHKDQEVIAWTRWDTDGRFRSVASLRRGGLFDEDSVYAVVERYVDGKIVKYVEVFRETYYKEVEDAYYVDSGMSLDDPLIVEAISLSNPVQLTITGHGLSDGDEIDLSEFVWEPDVDANYNSTQPDQLNGHRAIVQNATANTFELGTYESDSFDGTAYNDYIEGGVVRKAYDTVGGLWHLKGKTLVALANGDVVTGLTVSDSGTVTFARKYSRIHIGLSFNADVETLDMSTDDDVIIGSVKNVYNVGVMLERSRGMWLGPDSANLKEMKQREFEAYGEPTTLFTGVKTVPIPTRWNSNGRVFLRQPYPLPMNLLAIVPNYQKGERENG